MLLSVSEKKLWQLALERRANARRWTSWTSYNFHLLALRECRIILVALSLRFVFAERSLGNMKVRIL